MNDNDKKDCPACDGTGKCKHRGQRPDKCPLGCQRIEGKCAFCRGIGKVPK